MSLRPHRFVSHLVTALSLTLAVEFSAASAAQPFVVPPAKVTLPSFTIENHGDEPLDVEFELTSTKKTIHATVPARGVRAFSVTRPNRDVYVRLHGPQAQYVFKLADGDCFAYVVDETGFGDVDINIQQSFVSREKSIQLSLDGILRDLAGHPLQARFTAFRDLLAKHDSDTKAVRDEVAKLMQLTVTTEKVPAGVKGGVLSIWASLPKPIVNRVMEAQLTLIQSLALDIADEASTLPAPAANTVRDAARTVAAKAEGLLFANPRPSIADFRNEPSIPALIAAIQASGAPQNDKKYARILESANRIWSIQNNFDAERIHREYLRQLRANHNLVGSQRPTDHAPVTKAAF
jgi:hypothetical protein